MTDVYVAGVGLHPFGRYPNLGLKQLAAVAIHRALQDAGIGLKDVHGAWVANAYGGLLTGQESVRGQVVLAYAGLHGIPITNVENACAGGSTAFKAAVTSIRAGECDVALVVGVEKMLVSDTPKTIRAVATSADTEFLHGTGFQFIATYAIKAKRYMKSYGATAEDIARVTAKNRRNGCLNPYAHYRKQVTVEEIVQSRLVCDPLHLFMCSSNSDGAAAVILVSDRVVDRLGRGRSVKVLSSRLCSGEFHLGNGAVERIVMEAYDEAGVEPTDLGLIELHDAAASAEWELLESLRVFPPGEAYIHSSRGETEIQGRIPVNPSGGLIGRGHPVSATGVAQIIEVVTQLRGNAGDRGLPKMPKVGLTFNTGGRVINDKAAITVHILAR